jgi:hypothetical protein
MRDVTQKCRGGGLACSTKSPRIVRTMKGMAPSTVDHPARSNCCGDVAVKCFRRALLVASIAGPRSVDAQVKYIDRTCANCMVEATRVASLGADSAGYVGLPSSVARDRAGRYYVATRARPSEILVYDKGGRFLRSHGRAGKGPGEFEWIAGLLVDALDTIHVVDASARTWSVFTPAFQFARSFAIPGTYTMSAALAADGHVLVSAYWGSPAAAGLPVHELDATGRVLRSFGADRDHVTRSDLPATTFRRLTVGRRGDIWSARINEYRVELWDQGGTKVADYVRRPRPFPVWIEAPMLSPLQPPTPELRAIHVDAESRLWVMFSLADRRWRNAIEPWDTPEGRFYRAKDVGAIYDTVVEVVDIPRFCLDSSQTVWHSGTRPPAPTRSSKSGR